MKIFKEMGLCDPITRAVSDLGFTEPTPVQAQVIPKVLGDGQDIIALAQTGTGKTAAFGLPLLQEIDPGNGSVQALILSPTRELCMQITSDLQGFSKNMKGVHTVAVYGGAAITNQVKQLQRGAHIVVGTPGRVRDLLGRGVLKIGQIRWLVLDEADEMLQMGFREELDAILETTPEGRQTLLFSATMPEGIKHITAKYMQDPFEITVGKRNAGAENVEHDYYVSLAKHRYEVLKRIADMHPEIYGIVFCRTRRETKEVADKLMTDGYNADALHGDLSQAQRDYVMNRFRRRNIRILVATDVAARGLDVDELTHVINYNMPDDLEAYVHRSGRTGRAGKKGISISILHTRETGKVKELEKITGKKFNRVRVPGGEDVYRKQLSSLVGRMESVESANQQIDRFLPEIYEQLEPMSKEEVIRKFISLDFNRFLDYYKNAGDLNAEPVDKGGRSQARERNNSTTRSEKRSNRTDMHDGNRDAALGASLPFVRFYINLGSRNNLNPARLIGLLKDTTNQPGINVGKIDMMKGFSFFEVEGQHEELVLQSFSRNIRHEGTKVKVELSQGRGSGGGRTVNSGSRRTATRDTELFAGKHSAYTPKSRKKQHRKGVKRQY